MPETNDVASGDPEDFIDKIIAFPDGSSYQRVQPITDLRKDPGEGRILYICKKINPATSQPEGDDFVLKIKAQWPGPQELYHEGPSPLTNAELRALQLFREKKIENLPHLIVWKKAQQGSHGIHPGGYIIYTIMTLMPGQTLWDMGYWSLSDDQREAVIASFLIKLKDVRSLGISPYDCALRNVLWDPKSERASIVDFEHYHEIGNDAAAIEDEKRELQNWGLVHRPPPANWWQEWKHSGAW